VQSAGREPGEVKPLAKISVVAESASASCGDAVAGVGAAVIQERAAGRSTMPAPRQPGPSTRVQCTLQDGPAAGQGPVVRRRFPLGGAGGAVRGAQIARVARAPLPFGDSLKKGGARGGVSRGEGRGGGNGGQSVLARVCVRGPASIKLRCLRQARAVALCTIVALASESCRRRFPRCSDHAEASDASTS
jgi:hypothetical protein